ncbi:peptide ABC transporter substrate-binding protein [Streptomyces carminius]|uniref:Peptide ABC transporter substrate-binding protein n=1 Tax=Streptomyces carminius TaxID=2665496 RepID=A0A2M8MCQ6_9ACTN|nr:ABC transporter substrate-binding protein [Streptomyces carminius]PJF01991.1 peptide ABC transporter substrate-binding protein [Streptomyces carminius]
MRRTKRFTGAIAAVTVLAALATACGSGEADSSGNGVVRASWGDPQHPLEPANTNEVQGGKVLDMIFRGLKRYDPETGEAVNAVAESIETEDQRNFTVTLKKGWKFGDGSPVTASSFVDAWNYGALVTNNQINSYFFQYIEGYDEVHPADEGAKPTAETMSGLKALSDYVFTVRLNQKFSLWPQTLGYNAYAPLPESFFEDREAWLEKPVGNGPYKIDSYSRGQVMRLSRNEDYSGTDKARNEGVELRVYTDSNTAYTDLQAGNLDIADDIPASQLGNAERDLDGRYVNQPAGIIQTVSFPLYRKEWQGEDARKVRQGLSMAIDRKSITERIYHGTRVPATDLTSPVLGPDGGYAAGLCGQTCSYDPGRARKLIEEAGGLPGGSVTLTSNVDAGSHRQWMDAVCNSIKNVLDDRGACRVKPVGTFADYRKDVVAEEMTGMFRTGWQMDYPLIQNFLQPLYYTDASSNDSGYSSEEFDELLDRANAVEGKEAVALFRKAEKLLLQDLPAVPLWYQNGTAGYSDRVRDVKLNAFSVPVFTDIEVV